MRKITKLQEWARKRIYEIVVVAICVLALGGMVAQKEGFHMDELLSFELANAQFNPWIVPTQPEGRLAKFVRNEIDGANLGETTGNLIEVVKDVFQNRGESKLLSYIGHDRGRGKLYICEPRSDSRKSNVHILAPVSRVD